MKGQPASTSRNISPGRCVAIAVAAAFAGFAITALFFPHRDAPVPITPEYAASSAPETGPPSTAGLPPAQAELLLGNWNYDQQNWTHAIAHYEKAVAQGLDNADVRTDLANCYRFSHQPRKALELYEIAQRQNPLHEKSLFNAATLHAESLNDPARAADLLQQFLTRFPTSASAENARRILAQMNSGRNASGRQLVERLTRDASASQPPR